jgi:hypothetical protein
MAGEADFLKLLPSNTQWAVNIGIGAVVFMIGLISFCRKLFGSDPSVAHVGQYILQPDVVSLLTRLVEALEKIENNFDKETEEREIARRVEERDMRRQQRPPGVA